MGLRGLLWHHREHRCRHTLPGHWQPGASGTPPAGTPPAGTLLSRLLIGRFKGDPDAEAKCALLAEVCGAAALGYATRLLQPRAVVLHGKTAENGKSQILELARGLLPESAICSVPASKMGDERHVIGLVGKLLNASDEISAEAIASDTFKAVVTGEGKEMSNVIRIDEARGKDHQDTREDTRAGRLDQNGTSSSKSAAGVCRREARFRGRKSACCAPDSGY